MSCMMAVCMCGSVRVCLSECTLDQLAASHSISIYPLQRVGVTCSSVVQSCPHLKFTAPRQFCGSSLILV